MELFSLKNKEAMDKPIHQIDFIKYSPSSLATINNNISNILSQEKMHILVCRVLSLV